MNIIGGLVRRKKWSGPLGLCAGAMLLIAPGAGFAQTVALDGIVITSTKTSETAIDSLSGSSVMTSEDINNIQPDRASDLLKDIPGVSTQDDGDDPATAINIRGLQDFGRVNVMVEGARQNFQRSGHSADGQFYLEPELIKRVDITRGPVATIYGSGAIGGVVNFELVDPEDIIEAGNRWALQTKAKYDTNDKGILTSVSGAYAPNKVFSVLANVTWRDDEDYKDGSGDRVINTGETITSGLISTVIRPTEGMKIKLSGLVQDNDYVTGTPGSERDTHTVDKTFTAKMLYKAPDNDWLDLSVSTYMTTTDLDQTRISIPTPCSAFSVPPCTAVLGNKRSFSIETKGLDVHNTSRFKTGLLKHAFTYGGDIFQDDVATFDNAGSGAEFTPGGVRDVYGLFIQDQVKLGRWLELIGALRYDSYRVEGNGQTTTGSRVSPKATVGVSPVQGIQLFYTYAEGYRAPAITELFNAGVHNSFPFFDIVPNPDLQAETAKNHEVGVNVKYNNVLTKNDKFRAKVVAFDNSIKNYIEAVYDDSAFNFAACNFGMVLCGNFQYQNIDKARIRGLEVEASYDTGFMFTKFAYSHTRGDDEVLNVPLLTIYPDKFATTLGFRFLQERLTVGGRWLFVAAQNRIPPETRAGSLVTPSKSYNTLDLFLNYKFNNRISTAVNLNNVFDEDYTKYLNFGSSSTAASPSPGFNASVSMTVKFGG